MAKKKAKPSPPPADLVKLGNRLKELRKARGYTNHFAFAYENDLNPGQYGRYESGRGNITFLKLIEILNALDITVTEFFSKGFD